MERRNFVVGTAIAAGAVAAAAAHTRTAHAAPTIPPGARDDAFVALLTAKSDAQVPIALADYRAALVTTSPRTIARRLRRLVAAYVWSESAYFHDRTLVTAMRDMTDYLVAQQNSDGTYDIGNLHSPPDTSFAVQDLCLIIDLVTADDTAAVRPVRLKLERVIRKAIPALATGGVHTPNHRWEVCAALARIHRLTGDRRALARIEDWLGEGIDIDAEGQYSERSSTYASEVTNPCLLTMAWALERPALIGPVRRNLTWTLDLLEPNGEVECVHSRRQDQTRIRDVWWYLTQYRELALLDDDGRFAGVVAGILARGTGELGDFLAEILERPELAAPLPTAVALPTTVQRHFLTSELLRFRDGAVTGTVFGGTDDPEIPRIASGLSTNPTFLKFRSGAAILDSVRLSPRFFSTGHFRSETLTVSGTTAKLSRELAVPYHLPLPAQYRRTDGVYVLTDEGRFFSRMDFPHRPKQFRRLLTELTVRQVDGGVDLDVAISGSDTSYTVELCFRRGGTLTGTTPLTNPDEHQLVSGTGRYAVGSDAISFGPGTGSGAFQPVAMNPGERYTYLSGNLTPDGTRVYLTGTTPTRFTLQLRVD